MTAEQANFVPMWELVPFVAAVERTLLIVVRNVRQFGVVVGVVVVVVRQYGNEGLQLRGWARLGPGESVEWVG